MSVTFAFSLLTASSDKLARTTLVIHTKLCLFSHSFPTAACHNDTATHISLSAVVVGSVQKITRLRSKIVTFLLLFSVCINHEKYGNNYQCVCHHYIRPPMWKCFAVYCWLKYTPHAEHLICWKNEWLAVSQKWSKVRHKSALLLKYLAYFERLVQSIKQSESFYWK